MDNRYPLSQAVANFFSNGGSRAIVLRLSGDAAGTAKIAIGPIQLRAASPGAWGNALTARVDAIGTGFELVVEGEGRVESYPIRFDGPWAIDKILGDSVFVCWDGDPPSADARAIACTTTAFSGGSGGMALRTTDYLGDDGAGGINALAGTRFNLLCVPPDQPDADVDPSVWKAANALCAQRRAILIVDPSSSWQTPADVQAGLNNFGLVGASNAAIYFPRLEVNDSSGGPARRIAACGAIAGIYARTDVARGVWAAPAGSNATIKGASDLSVAVTDTTASALASLNVNALRQFNGSMPVVFGARTLSPSSEYRYVNVLRMSQFIENSVRIGMNWVLSAPSNDMTWSQMRNLASTFLLQFFQQGAFQGSKPEEAFFVRCDATTTTPLDIREGRINMLIGFAPLKAGQFVFVPITWQRPS